MTAKKIIGYLCGGVMFAAGLALYICGTVFHRSDLIQPGYWLTTVGSGTLGLQITLPGSSGPPPA